MLITKTSRASVARNIKKMEEEEILRAASKADPVTLSSIISRAIHEENYALVTKLRAYYK